MIIPDSYALPHGLGQLPKKLGHSAYSRSARAGKAHHAPNRDLECGVVPVHFVGENFRIVVLGQEDFELQRARFIFQAACLVRR